MFLLSNLIWNGSGEQTCQNPGSGSGLLTSACVASVMAGQAVATQDKLLQLSHSMEKKNSMHTKKKKKKKRI